MATTSILGLVYPDESSVASINVSVGTLAGSVDAKVGPYATDTDWIAVSPLGGFVGVLTYRKVGKTVEVTANGTGSFPSGSGVTIGNLPAAIRPLGTRRSGCWLTGSNTGTIGVSANGNIDINHASGATRNAIQASISYFIG